MFFKFQGYHLAYISFFNDLFYVSVCAYGYPWRPEEDVGFLKLELEVIVSTNIDTLCKSSKCSLLWAVSPALWCAFLFSVGTVCSWSSFQLF